ncbi:MAG: hypothetical protein LBC53_03820 [Spirochaetaceae bacterium]|jgi:2-dehydro-3-deoxyphosphogluconate aldolase/(4S)-4-hydroxy-2-oxoglutarate aldolase|nr:hypothetical protein [Spirochaetaceae bacterium]
MDDELKALNFHIVHVGMNAKDMPSAEAAANDFFAAFGFSPDKRSASVFAGPQIEIMSGVAGTGTHGHLALGTSNIEKAAEYLKKKGYAFKAGSEKYKDKKMIAVYLEKEFSGFAVHLLQC